MGPIAVETLFGWVLSGPTQGVQEETVVNLSSTHQLCVDLVPDYGTLDAELKQFWELESLGILPDEHPVRRKFSQQISFKDGRYEVHLPWKESHPILQDNYDLCHKRLNGLLQRLRQDPEQLKQYDSVIREQLDKGVIELVTNPANSNGKVHYLPHHGVVRDDKQTTKLRVVYDASARVTGPSLNDCLYTGLNFDQNILHILLRFRLHQIAFIGDIEKAFLMVSIVEQDRDSLRFLWISDIQSGKPSIQVYHFTRVVFGVS